MTGIGSWHSTGDCVRFVGGRIHIFRQQPKVRSHAYQLGATNREVDLSIAAFAFFESTYNALVVAANHNVEVSVVHVLEVESCKF